MTALVLDGLQRHAPVILETIRSAQPEPRSLMLAIERARSIPVRMVSIARVTAVLDAAEALVTDRVVHDAGQLPV